MAYGAIVYEADGVNFTDVFSPYNIIDSFYLSAAGTASYSLASGESLAVIDMNPYFSNGACCVVTISGGTVSWANRANTKGLGASAIVAWRGSKICVVKKR